MGVSGCGKTTIGKQLASRMGLPFEDGDDYHSKANRAKILHGEPLTDEDRREWLFTLVTLINGYLRKGQSCILACSALKQIYRDRLTVDPDRVRFVYLKGSRELILQRIEARRGHIMKASLLDSQFSILEEPSQAIVVDIGQSPFEVTNFILAALKKEGWESKP
jgi:carbohydrate kinase (thermoresistant glucokinase family)